MKYFAGLVMALSLVRCDGGCSDPSGGTIHPDDADQNRAETSTSSHAPVIPAAPWAQTFGGSGDDEGLSVALAPDKAVIIAGFFHSKMVVGDIEVGSRGGSDAVISAFEPTGEVRWIRAFGGSGDDCFNGLVVLPNGDVAVTGRFEGVVDFGRDSSSPVDGERDSSLRRESAGHYDTVVLLLDGDGNLQWVKTFGGSGWDEGHDIAFDSRHRLVVAGSFSSSVDFSPSEGEDRRTASGETDAFLMRLEGDGTFDGIYTFGGAGADVAKSLSIAPGGAIALAGWFSNSVDFDAGEGEEGRTARGFSDLFVTMLRDNLEHRWTWTAGGSLVDQALALSVDNDSGVWVTGFFVDLMSIRTHAEMLELRARGRSDVFVARLGIDGQPTWAVAFGGEAADYGDGIAFSETGEAVVTGRFGGVVNLDEGRLDESIVAAGRSDAFVLSYGSAGDLRWSKAFGGEGRDRGKDIAYNDSMIIVTGAFEGEVDFMGAPVAGSALRAAGAADIFLLNFLP